MLQEFRRSVSSVFADRFTSPVFGTLFVSWIIINWETALVLISSSMGTLEKISYIEKHWNFWGHIGYPAISSVVVMLIYPWLAIAGFYVWENPKRHKRAIKNKLEENTLLTKEEQAALRIEIRGVEDRYNDLARGSKEIEEGYRVLLSGEQEKNRQLEEKVIELRSFAENLSSEINRLRQPPKDDTSLQEITLLTELNGEDNGSAMIDRLTQATGIKKGDLRYYLDRLSEKSLVQFTPGNTNLVRLTTQGRKFLYERKTQHS